MKNFYDPKDSFPEFQYKEEDEDVNDFLAEEKIVEFKDDKLFHLGQSYENEVADTIYCKNCGGNEFNVGKGAITLLYGVLNVNGRFVFMKGEASKMEDHGIFKGENLMILCGSKEKAEKMVVNYPGAEVFPAECVDGKWVKKK